MLDAMQTIADGNLDKEIYGDFGIFNPFRDELTQIQTDEKGGGGRSEKPADENGVDHECLP